MYMAALLLDWCYCMIRVMLRKRVKDTPRKQLVWDIAGVCTGDVSFHAAFNSLVTPIVPVRDSSHARAVRPVHCSRASWLFCLAKEAAYKMAAE